MPRMSKIELFAAIRRDAAAGMSGRAIEKKYRIGRRTVSAAMSSALPPPRKAMPPRGSKLDPFKLALDDILRADLDAPRKQRHTVRRIHHRLLDEHGMADVSYQVVRTYVADRKPKIRAESGRGPIKVFFPQTHRPGAEAVKADDGKVPLQQRYDTHERTFGPPLPHLLQRITHHRLQVIPPDRIRELLADVARRANAVDVDGTPLRFTPHDFRRIFSTETVNSGLPIHIAAKLLGQRKHPAYCRSNATPRTGSARPGKCSGSARSPLSKRASVTSQRRNSRSSTATPRKGSAKAVPKHSPDRGSTIC
ncbi:hypothetical protein [Actinoplanes solisilvae]|uniref:hypothetical protein n=1 Tax=Actinoplanes solisilvae TaxID=2486853 RepID=UPI0013E36E56|nr:hypothetical protein [Actinoplanes solisilvae]